MWVNGGYWKHALSWENVQNACSELYTYMTYKEDVGGSSPSRPTIKAQIRAWLVFFLNVFDQSNRIGVS